jgi:carbamoyltransferase
VNIIGISAFFHDSACCLMQDGRLVAAAEEERFTRRKHDSGIPSAAFRYCLREGGITIADVDCVAYYEDPCKKLARQLWSSSDLSPLGNAGLLRRLDPGRVEREIRQKLKWDGAIEIVDHHLSHAASSFYFSGFEEAALLTVDGVGEWTSTAFGSGAGDGIRFFKEIQFPDSIGLLYTTLTTYLGFAANDGECKVMGLAPYGRPVHLDQINQLGQAGQDGELRLDLTYFDFLRDDRMYSEALPQLFGRPPRRRHEELEPFHADVASSLQCWLEAALLDHARYVHRMTGSRNLCLAGGVALNCVANGKIAREGPFQRVFVPPAAGDGGGAIGAAAVAHVRRAPGNPCAPLSHAYLGPAFSPADIARLIAATGFPACDFRERESGLLEEAARRLEAGQVVAWFQGRMEYGPRALGSRSLLADARRPEMRDHINALVKKREAFRPFAPAVLEQEASRHFDLDHPSPYMLETCYVRSPLTLPAISHVDGSARVQTVNENTNPRFASLLHVFGRRTGYPLLLNTSFNMRDEPIVCTPKDALICFLRSGVDALVLGDFLLDRDDCSQSRVRPVVDRLCGAAPASSSPSDTAYTLW